MGLEMKNNRLTFERQADTMPMMTHPKSALAAATALLLVLSSCEDNAVRDYEPGISLSLFSGRDIPTEAQLREVKDAGVEWVEVIMNPLAWDLSEEESLERAMSEKAMLDKVGLKVWSCHLPYGECSRHNYDISVIDDGRRQDAIAQDRRMVELSRLFSPSRIVLHPSAEPVPDEERAQRLVNSRESIGIIAKAVRETGALLCVEELPRTCLGNTTDEMMYLIGDYPEVMCTFDLNHLLGDTHEHFFSVMGSRIRHIHASEYDSIDEKHWLPGVDGGTIDWPCIVRNLRNIGYDGVFMFEVRNGDNVNPQTIAGAYDWISKSAKLRRITLEDIQYSHMGQLAIDRKGNCFASFLQNYGDGNERLRSETSEVTLACFPLERALADDFSPEKDVTLHRIGGLGDSFLGYQAASIFKDNSMCLDGNTLHMTFQFLPTTDDIAHLFKTDFDIRTGTFSGNEECMISYEGSTEPFTIRAVGRIIESEGGVAPQVQDNILELVSQWSRYRGWWYATLACAGKTGSNGLVVRTKDFKDMEYVAMPPFNQDGMAEISSIIKGGKLYVACRQNYGIFKLLLSYYDLRKGTWGPVTEITDGNSRPWFFIRKGKLYLMNTPDKPRKYIDISELGMDRDSITVNKVAGLQDCGYYYATAAHRGRMYMVVTHNTESFGPLDIF